MASSFMRAGLLFLLGPQGAHVLHFSSDPPPPSVGSWALLLPLSFVAVFFCRCQDRRSARIHISSWLPAPSNWFSMGRSCFPHAFCRPLSRSLPCLIPFFSTLVTNFPPPAWGFGGARSGCVLFFFLKSHLKRWLSPEDPVFFSFFFEMSLIISFLRWGFFVPL